MHSLIAPSAFVSKHRGMSINVSFSTYGTWATIPLLYLSTHVVWATTSLSYMWTLSNNEPSLFTSALLAEVSVVSHAHMCSLNKNKTILADKIAPQISLSLHAKCKRANLGESFRTVNFGNPVLMTFTPQIRRTSRLTLGLWRNFLVNWSMHIFKIMVRWKFEDSPNNHSNLWKKDSKEDAYDQQ